MDLAIKRSAGVALEYASYLFPVSDVLESPKEEDALALGFGDRLHDPRLSRILLKLLHKNVILRLKILIFENLNFFFTKYRISSLL